jgi:hypothetical protein
MLARIHYPVDSSRMRMPRIERFLTLKSDSSGMAILLLVNERGNLSSRENSTETAPQRFCAKSRMSRALRLSTNSRRFFRWLEIPPQSQ